MRQTPIERASKRISRKLKANSKLDPLEKRTLLAIAENQHAQASQLLETMSRRNQLGLQVVKGGKESPPPPSSKDISPPQ